MGWRFRKRIKIAPGVALNLSKGMPTVSLGGSPATLKVGRGTKLTTSIPGTGLSHTRAIGGKASRQTENPESQPPGKTLGARLLTWAIALAMFGGIAWWLK